MTPLDRRPVTRAIAEATNGHHRQSQLTAQLQPAMMKMIVKLKGRQVMKVRRKVTQTAKAKVRRPLLKRQKSQRQTPRMRRKTMTPVRKVLMKMR